MTKGLTSQEWVGQCWLKKINVLIEGAYMNWLKIFFIGVPLGIYELTLVLLALAFVGLTEVTEWLSQVFRWVGLKLIELSRELPSKSWYKK